MKNLFKFGFLGLALALTVAACDSNTGENTEEAADTTTIITPSEPDTTVIETDTTITTDTIG
ncbi:hypothetical protein H8S90_19155 [Olivibacter sp. SDN3]|uniref:hypothetical protein n=1 Tax=Olivibacter sp. SDN3 TaxID=2764720 RepID=UPI00165198DB|nr:hypothetical protein [Olivibacter sp. SDN3]QNL48857.1 hypothetical protein H8S90_19155 [Olivibacter sp. SDN3]